MSNDSPAGTQSTSQREGADRFADLACLCYFGVDHVSRREQAARMLAESPEVTAASCHAAAAAFDVKALGEHLSADSSAAVAGGGPRDWPPLLYVCYSRIPEDPPERDAVAALEVLLAAGADGNTFLVDRKLGGWRWSGLTGAMGEGEEGLLQQPPHARARELAGILLDAGADPNDAQGLYNTMFTPDDEWLELLLAHGLKAADVVDPDGDPPIRTLDYQLCQAVKMGMARRVSLLLEHGADVDAADIYNGRSNYENALLRGHPQIAARLVEHGAEARELSVEDRFTAAVMSGDESAARQLLEAEPDMIENPALLLEAVNNAATIRLMLALGADPNAPQENGRVPLHEAAWSNNAEVVQLLLDHGASCEIRERDHNATPVGFANHAGHFELRDLLLDHSHNAFDLAAFGRVSQLAEVLEADPGLARARGAGGHTLFHAVAAGPSCEQLLDLLAAHGVDINAPANDGATPLFAALERGDEELAAMLRARGARD